MTPIQKANIIIEMFIDNEVPLAQQLQILKIVKDRIDFCRRMNQELYQLKLEL